jgi:nucleoside-triphosphatase THEP1
MKNKDKIEIYDRLINVNDRSYNMLKAAEELQELALALIQKLNKDNITDDTEIIDEIGDVEIRMKVLKKMFSEKKVKIRINYKLKKFRKYITTNTYKNI